MKGRTRSARAELAASTVAKAGITAAELEVQLVEMLPERAAMSTLNVTLLDATTTTVEGVADGVSEGAHAAQSPPGVEPSATATSEPSHEEPVGTTTAEPEPVDAEQSTGTTAEPEPADDTEQGTTTTTTPEPAAEDAETISTTTADPDASGSQPDDPRAGIPADHPRGNAWASGEHPGQGEEHRSIADPHAAAATHASVPGQTAVPDAAPFTADESTGDLLSQPMPLPGVEPVPDTFVPEDPTALDSATQGPPTTGIPADPDEIVESVADTTAMSAGAASGTAAAQSLAAVQPVVNETLGTVGGVLNDTLGTVSDQLLPAVDDTVNTVGDTVADLLGALEGTSLLDLDADLDLDLDGAVPISAAIAADANVAVPIDASVSASALSPDSTSFANADQDAALQQSLLADAIANTSQDSAIDQGEINEDVVPTDAVTTTMGDLSTDGALLDLDVDLDLALDLAAPIDAAVAANLNIAAPIDAAVSANILSPGSTSLATADQDAMIVQTLQGLSQATADQTSVIDQGESAP